MAAKPALTISSVAVAAGQPATLTLSLNSEIQGACGLMLTLNYTSASPALAPPIQLNSLSMNLLSTAFSGALYASAGVHNPVSGLPFDQERNIAIVHGQPVDGPADVMTLPFQPPAIAAVGTVYMVSVSVIANDAFGNKFAVGPASGTITVSGPAIVDGDINGDGHVDIRDALLVLRAILHLNPLTLDQQSRADVNHDGQLNISDAVAILRIAVGLGGSSP